MGPLPRARQTRPARKSQHLYIYAFDSYSDKREDGLRIHELAGQLFVPSSPVLFDTDQIIQFEPLPAVDVPETVISDRHLI